MTMRKRIPEFTQDKVQTAIDSLKKGKASDNTTKELRRRGVAKLRPKEGKNVKNAMQFAAQFHGQVEEVEEKRRRTGKALENPIVYEEPAAEKRRTS